MTDAHDGDDMYLEELRDAFAKAALSGAIASGAFAGVGDGAPIEVKAKALAKDCWVLAEAMVQERPKR